MTKHLTDFKARGSFLTFAIDSRGLLTVGLVPGRPCRAFSFSGVHGSGSRFLCLPWVLCGLAVFSQFLVLLLFLLVLHYFFSATLF